MNSNLEKMKYIMNNVSSIDLIIEEYKKGVDRTLLEENLKLSYTERVEKLQRLLRTFEELKNAKRQNSI